MIDQTKIIFWQSISLREDATNEGQLMRDGGERKKVFNISKYFAKVPTRRDKTRQDKTRQDKTR